MGLLVSVLTCVLLCLQNYAILVALFGEYSGSRVNQCCVVSCSFIMHLWCMDFGSVVCFGPVVGSGASN